jgi:hypothetical protein
MRVEGRPIYAAQFHIELSGTPQSSLRIMDNFLKLAKGWSGNRVDTEPMIAPE